MKHLSFFSFMVIVLISACTSPRDKTINYIKTTEKTMWSDSGKFEINKEVVEKVVLAYQKFADEFPADSLAPEYLFKEAELTRSLKQFDKSISIWQNIMDKYPNYAKTPHCLFLQGFVYENDMNNVEKAREKYNLFLEKYPNHELAKDVNFSISNLGKTPEEIIKQFELNQKGGS